MLAPASRRAPSRSERPRHRRTRARHHDASATPRPAPGRPRPGAAHEPVGLRRPRHPGPVPRWPPETTWRMCAAAVRSVRGSGQSAATQRFGGVAGGDGAALLPRLPPHPGVGVAPILPLQAEARGAESEDVAGRVVERDEALDPLRWEASRVRPRDVRPRPTLLRRIYGGVLQCGQRLHLLSSVAPWKSMAETGSDPPWPAVWSSTLFHVKPPHSLPDICKSPLKRIATINRDPNI
ncbi:hypothetical protein SEVIR_7G176801v4 [Setaria viridis]